MNSRRRQVLTPARLQHRSIQMDFSAISKQRFLNFGTRPNNLYLITNNQYTQPLKQLHIVTLELQGHNLLTQHLPHLVAVLSLRTHMLQILSLLSHFTKWDLSIGVQGLKLIIWVSLLIEFKYQSLPWQMAPEQLLSILGSQSMAHMQQTGPLYLL